MKRHLARFALAVGILWGVGGSSRGDETTPSPQVDPPTTLTVPSGLRVQALKTETSQAAAESDESARPTTSRAEAEVATPTHYQTGLLKIDGGDLPATKINCFATTAEGELLAGCGTSNENGEIRVFDTEGNYVETWSTPVMVDAIGVRTQDGAVFVAGSGRLVRFDAAGNLQANEPSPHATVSKENAEKIREEIIARSKQMVTTYERQIGVYDKQIKLATEQVERLKAKLDELAEEDDKAREQLEATMKSFEQRSEALKRNRDAWKERVAQMEKQEPSEEVIQKQIEAQIARKLAVASLSAVGDDVFVACSSTTGYGYSVWKVSDDLKSGEEIVSDLRGCCGQMDVQASADGIYVAENSRHRVVCFDPAGKETVSWGRSGEGPEAFSSCCNPMNVAFDQNGSVYTSESNSGRIKRYAPDGKLQQVIGSVDLVPGCKKVSIGVAGDRIYMLDITRNHVVVMEPISPEKREEMIAATMAGETPEAPPAAAADAAVEARPAAPALRLRINRSLLVPRATAPAPPEQSADE